MPVKPFGAKGSPYNFYGNDYTGLDTFFNGLEDYLSENGINPISPNKLVEHKVMAIPTGEANNITEITGFIQPIIICRRHAVFFKNPSTESDLDISLNNIIGEDKFSVVDSSLNPVVVTVPKGSNYMLLIEGLYVGEGVELSVKAKSAVTTEFNLDITIKEA